MIIRTLYSLFFGLLMTATSVHADDANQAGNTNVSTYKLGPGDVISVVVYGEEGFVIDKARLPESGSITVPLIGNVQTSGLTTNEVQALVTDELKKGYLKKPSVSVTLNEYRPFFIGGEVMKPGGYPFQPGLTLQRAVALAGGYTERASERKITIIRERASGEVKKKVDAATLINPGDTITVPQGFF